LVDVPCLLVAQGIVERRAMNPPTLPREFSFCRLRRLHPNER
jgi:hypothetical protein